LKKIVLILVLICIAQSVSGQIYWQKPAGFAPLMDLNRIAVADSSKFYIAADSGKIFFSSNGGTNWITQNSGILNNIVDINFPNVNTGFAIAWEIGTVNPNYYGSLLLKTTNAGTNWNVIKIDTNNFNTTVRFMSPMNGYLLGHPSGIMQTTDGGLNWKRDSIEAGDFSTYPVRTILSMNSQFSIACGGWNDIQGVVWRTANSGVTWSSQGISPEPFYGIHAYNNNHIIVVGGDYEYGASMGTTTNGGLNWSYLTFEEFGIASGISFRTQSEGWIALNLGEKFLFTINEGDLWRTWETPNNETINDVKFANKRNGIAVGLRGAILKYNMDLVNISNPSSNLPDKIQLKQNYPNPFNPETIISFSLEKTNYVSLKIYDMLGKEIKTLIDEVKKPGEYNIKFFGDNIPAGVYYYTLKSGNDFKETKKMILVK